VICKTIKIDIQIRTPLQERDDSESIVDSLRGLGPNTLVRFPARAKTLFRAAPSLVSDTDFK